MRVLFASVETQTHNALSVGQLNHHIKAVLESDPILEDVAVTGEISSFKLHGSGHAYFCLKDETAQIRCCLWKRNALSLRFRPNDGDRVIAYGHVEFYPQRGETSFIVESLHFAGQGAQWEAFERLKAALAADGLFDAERKKPLPESPTRIGLITSGTGAAPHDVISVLSRRWPLAKVLLIPCLVQGYDAPHDIIRALSWAAAWEDLDVVIVARGGGSAEDLWCFNDEALCRYAADFPLPLVSAVGHETDFTLFDFIADMRAATPTAAAELVSPDIAELHGAIASARRHMCRSLQNRFQVARLRLDALRARKALTEPQVRVEREREKLTRLKSHLHEAAGCKVQIEQQRLDKYCAQLRALDPMRVLDRGYALLLQADNKVLSSAAAAQAGQKLRARLHDGELSVTVTQPPEPI
jgi:exodeoxyribonuclease VII large subunit